MAIDPRDRNEEVEQWAEISDQYRQEIYDEEDDLLRDPEQEAGDLEARTERKRERVKLAEGIGDFLAVVLGAAFILLLAAVLISLTNWLKRDIGSTLAIIFKKI